MLKNNFIRFFLCIFVLLCGYIILHHAPVKLDHTLCIIKPGKSFQHRFEIQKKLEDNGFFIVDFLNLHLNKTIVTELYTEHKGKNFYDKLVDFMTESTSQVLLLRRENAVNELRRIMNEIRQEFMEDETRNAIHGSDSNESASREISLFFRRG